MASSLIVDAYNLSKTYKVYNKPFDKLKEILSHKNKQHHKIISALDNVSFSLRRGDRLGILGENGSGKSTLLKILAGVLTPSSGNCIVSGRVSSLLELGTGFNPELSGRENVYQNGLIFNYTKKEMDKRFPIIHEFSEIDDFINQPVKTYSTGMMLRLAFSCAVHVDPEILIIDEALSVGDMYFQNKCFYKIKSMLEQGTTFVYVSHNTEDIKSLCHKAVMLDQGKIIEQGKAEDVANFYTKYLYEKQNKSSWNKIANAYSQANNYHNEYYGDLSFFNHTYEFNISENFEKRVSPFRTGNGAVRIRNIEVINSAGFVTEIVHHGEEVIVAVFCEVFGLTDPNLSLGVGIYDDKGIEIKQFNSLEEDVYLGNLSKSDRFVIFFKFKNILKPGNYSITTGLANLIPSHSYKNYHIIDLVVDNCVAGYNFRVPFEVEKSIYGKVSVPVEAGFKKLN